MNKKRNKSINRIITAMLFLELVTIFVCVITFPNPVYRILYYIAWGFFAVAILTIVIEIVNREKTKELIEKENEALLYMSKNKTWLIRASEISLLFGEDVYLNLLQKGYIDTYFVEGNLEVYCVLTEIGDSHVLKPIKHLL